MTNTAHTAPPHPQATATPITPPPSPPHSNALQIEHPSPRAHFHKFGAMLDPLPENPNSPDRPHRGSYGPILESRARKEVLPLSPTSPKMTPKWATAPAVPGPPSHAGGADRAAEDHSKRKKKGSHKHGPRSPTSPSDTLHPPAPHGSPGTPGHRGHWASEGPHDVRRSPIPEEREEQSHQLHHESSADTIRASAMNGGVRARPPLVRQGESTKFLPRPMIRTEASGETIRRTASPEDLDAQAHKNDGEHAEPIGRSRPAPVSAPGPDTVAVDESREPITRREVHSPPHAERPRRKRGMSQGAQPRPLMPPMPPRRASSDDISGPLPPNEAQRASALDAHRVVEHLCEVQAVDVALVNSITALDAKVDRLLLLMGIEVGAVGIHGKLDAVLAKVGEANKPKPLQGPA